MYFCKKLYIFCVKSQEVEFYKSIINQTYSDFDKQQQSETFKIHEMLYSYISTETSFAFKYVGRPTYICSGRVISRKFRAMDTKNDVKFRTLLKKKSIKIAFFRRTLGTYS